MSKALRRLLYAIGIFCLVIVNDCAVITVAASLIPNPANLSPRIEVYSTLTAMPTTIDVTATITPTSTVEPTIAPTFTPLPTETPIPTSDFSEAQYRVDVATQLMIIQPNLLAVSDLSDQASKNYLLIKTDYWQSQFFGAIDEMIAASKVLSEIDTPAKFEAVQSWLRKLYPELVAMKADLRKGVDTLDPEYIRRGSEHMRNVADYVTNSTAELDKVQ